MRILPFRARAAAPHLPPLAWQERRQQHRRRLLWLGLGALAGLSGVDHAGWLLYAGNDRRRYDGRVFAVAGVVDVQTLELRVPDAPRQTTRARLWGVLPPESGRWGRPRGAGGAAVSRLGARLAGREIRVRLEPQRTRDARGRLLVFARLPDGTVLNEWLLAEGLALADPGWPHPDLERYGRLEAWARRAKRGVWRPPASSAAPG